MNNSSSFRASIIVFTASLISFATHTMAATIPLAGVDIIAKNVVSSRILSTYTDNNGYFKMGAGIENGTYDIFIGNESLPPVKTQAKNGFVTGRVVMLTENTTTTDNIVKSQPVIKKVSTPKPFIAPLLKQK